MTTVRNLALLFVGVYAIWLLWQAGEGAAGTRLQDGDWLLPVAVCVAVVVLTVAMAHKPRAGYRRRKRK